MYTCEKKYGEWLDIQDIMLHSYEMKAVRTFKANISSKQGFHSSIGFFSALQEAMSAPSSVILLASSAVSGLGLSLGSLIV